MYFDVTAIKLCNKSQASLQICQLCKNDLVFCYNFKIKCQRSDNILNSLLNEIVTKEIDVKSPMSLLTKIEIESNGEEITKDEMDEQEDVEYLDEIDFNIENYGLGIIKAEEQSRNMASFAIIDSKDISYRTSPRRKHKLAKERKKLYSCSICPKKFLKVKMMKAHIRSEHGPTDRPHSCVKCKKTFSSEHDLNIHSALHTVSDRWTCNKCNKDFQDKARFRRHIQRHMEAKRHTCAVCGKPFSELYALRRHERVHTGQLPDKRHECHLCEKRYSSRTLLAAHVGQHNGIRPCVCSSCGKTFPSQRLLTSHRLVHSDSKPYACRYCDKTFRHESTRNTHHRTHTGEKPYICASCGKSFIQRSNLVLHMRTHTGERPYSCKLCDRSFTSSSSLKNHTRTHTGDKPYSCSVCGKRFARVNMRAHMARHTGERPHECSVCSKRFASAWRLREHCRLHTGEKPFECAHCTDKFATKSQLMKHFKTHQKQRRQTNKREVFVVRQLADTEGICAVADNVTFSDGTEKRNAAEIAEESNGTSRCESVSGPNSVHAQDLPLEVTEEVVLQDEGEEKTEVVVENVVADGEYRNGDVCASTDGVNFGNYVTVNEGGVSISSNAMLEGATVKLYQLDQSLVQIHRSRRQLTISKITSSKMTANF
ncbi:unnamed protein product, partial [Iphiclides podalirius]